MQNFGKIKNAFNVILAEGVGVNNIEKKNLLKKYVKTLKESDILKTQFLVYDNLEKLVETDQFLANLILNENLNLLKKFNSKDILKENKKLISLSREVEDSLNSEYDSKISDLHESFSNLIFIKKNPNTINEISINTKKVLGYITTNQHEEINEGFDVPNSMLASILVEKYNEKYSDLDETEKKVIKLIIESTNEEKIEYYKNIKNECIDLIDLKLKESDIETKDSLLKVKDKLLRETIKLDENYPKSLTKLLDLKNTLDNEE
jgi:hypothetical protein